MGDVSPSLLHSRASLRATRTPRRRRRPPPPRQVASLSASPSTAALCECPSDAPKGVRDLAAEIALDMAEQICRIVFTAHPTFGLKADLRGILARLASGFRADGHPLTEADVAQLERDAAAQPHRPEAPEVALVQIALSDVGHKTGAHQHHTVDQGHAHLQPLNTIR